MAVSREQVNFAAVLVFKEGTRRRAVEPHVFSATHPEVAYRCALAKGREARYEREFVGLAELAVTVEDVAPVGKTEGGDPFELVVPKEQLSAFQDPRWIGVPPDPAEVEAALREPPALVDLPGLDQVDWSRVSHAYGQALDVPIDLRRLASTDAEVRANALWQLGGSICHQGDIFDATAAAVPFLVALASSAALPNRVDILELLAEIAASATATDPEAIRAGWAKRQAKWPTIAYARPPAEMAEAQIAAGLATQTALNHAEDVLRRLGDAADSAVSAAAGAVLRAMEGPPRGRPAAD
jgi:hypothetical protein